MKTSRAKVFFRSFGLQPSLNQNIFFVVFSLAVLGFFICFSSALANEPKKIKQVSRKSILDLPLNKLMEMEVSTVSRQASTVGKSAAAVFVITPEMIRRSGATMIPELFRMVPGMNVIRVDNSKWNVSARGFNGDRLQGKLLVQLDGRVLYNPIFSGVYWDQVDTPLEDIERIEIIRGSGASVWGANAVNGIINIITKTAKQTQGGLAVAGGGNQDRGFGTFRYGGKINEDLHYRFYVKGFNRAPQYNSTGSSNDEWWGTSTGTQFNWQPSIRDQLMVQASYLHGEANRTDVRPMLTTPFSFLNRDSDISNMGSVLTRWTRQLNPESHLALQFYWDHFDRTSNVFDMKYEAFDVDFQHQLQANPRWNIIYGAGYRLIDANVRGSTNLDGEFALSFAPSHKRQTQVFTAFLQNQFTLIKKRLLLTLGSKVEHNSYTDFEIQPTARLLWTPNAWQTIWTAVSRAVRTPNFLEREATINQPPSFPTPGSPLFPSLGGNANFQSENQLSFELGYRVQKNSRFSADIAGFFNLYDDLKVNVAGAPIAGPVAGTSLLPIAPQNRMKAQTFGVELAMTTQATSWLKFAGNYTFLNTRFDPDPTLSAATQAAAKAGENLSSAHQFYLQSSVDLSHNIEFDLIGRFASRIKGFNPNGAFGFPDRVDNNFSMDARLGWKPRKNLTLELVGQNLLQNHHLEAGSSPTIRAPVVEIKRSVYGKATWVF